MSDRLGQVTPKECIRALERLGFVVRRITGSHTILRHSQKSHITVVPLHAKDLKRGTLFHILKKADISNDEFKNAL